MKNRILVRVYGLLIGPDFKILVSDELIYGKQITKFPGGGLEFGEGLLDCLKREFMEETGQEILVGDHFYTTDFFQQSAFNKDDQVLSVYYKVECKTAANIIVVKTPTFKNGAESFRWIPLSEINEKTFSLPIDKLVGELLKKQSLY